MIFRKPYAFLIKNFRKIHILLFILCSFLLYKTIQLVGFVKDFITYVSYDPYLEPITKYTSVIFYIFILSVIVISITLLLLLRRKNKPWILYLIPIVTYIFILVLFMSIQNYFVGYEGETSTATARAFRDFLNIGTIPQYVTLIILSIRILGLDLKKFSFGNDEEFLELDQNDKEEVEVSINFDKHIFQRLFKKTLRLLGYFYQEHKLIVNIVFVLVMIFLIGSSALYIINHKPVAETKVLNANGYSISVNESYFTNLDKMGNVLEQDSNFVVLNLTVKNNSYKRKLNMSNFHLVNGKHDIVFSGSTYSKYFTDIGKEYKVRDFEAGEERTFALIFKVDKKLSKNNFVLYYQQYQSYKNIYLRKLKLNLKEISTIVKNPSKNINEELIVTYPNGTKKNMIFETVNIVGETTYRKEICGEDQNCFIDTFDIKPLGNYKVLQIDFASDDFEGEELIDFSINYGKIRYIDNENITRELKIEDATDNAEYLGNYLYIKIPTNLETAKSIEFIYTLRNQQYSYKIK